MDWTNLRTANHHEWLLTNGRGGYALGFGDFLGERKYNGLLVAGLERFRRVHVLSSLEEEVEWQGARFNLDANHYPNCIHPQGYSHIIKSWLRPFPAVLYSADPVSENHLILKEVFLVPGANGVVVKYTNLGRSPLNLTLRPKFTLRDHHALNPAGCWDRGGHDIVCQELSFGLTRSNLDLPVQGFLEFGAVVPNRIVFRDVYYPMEAARGYQALEDLLSPADCRFKLEPREANRLLVGLDLTDGQRDLFDRAEEVYQDLPLAVDHPRRISSREDWLDSIMKSQRVYQAKDYHRILGQAARDFLTEDDIIAGFPWFGPWSRDTLIAMEGLPLLKGGTRLAVKILKKYGRSLKGGLLPNTFGEGDHGLNYDSVDAPLWYVLRVFELAPKNKELFKRCLAIVLSYLFSPDPRLEVGADGLIGIRAGDYALTWMDAKIYGSPVTPRHGRPVEINGLWYNALLALEAMARDQGLGEGDLLRHRSFELGLDRLARLGKRVKRSLRGFVQGDFLADRLTAAGPVLEVRPNAVIAASLPFDWLPQKTMAAVLGRAEAELLTAKGLRSLSPRAPAFKKKYLGHTKQRDLAYHQGTVWAWLLWPLARLYLKVNQGKKSPRTMARELTGYVWRFRSAFMRNHISSVAEIWDGLEPDLPKGCPAQAWSVMALLLIERTIKDLEAAR